MANDDKLVEIMVKQDLMVEELRGVKNEVSSVKNEVSSVKNEVSSVKNEVSSVKNEVSSVKSEIVKLNLQTAENTRAILTLADKVEHIADLQSRVSKLEKAVFK
jgi:predicted  nucleic acid-binding Zn-ribbon protein